MATITAQANAATDLELKFTAGGKAVGKVNVAENHYRNDNGQWQQTGVTWYRLTIFDKAAELAAEHIRKGDRIVFTGELKTEEWQDKEGNVKSSLEVLVKRWGIVPKSTNTNAANNAQWGAQSTNMPPF